LRQCITRVRRDIQSWQASYVEAWLAVTDVQHGSPEALARLKDHPGSAARKAIDQATDDNPYADRGG
jgi:hypothetical protein